MSAHVADELVATPAPERDADAPSAPRPTAAGRLAGGLRRAPEWVVTLGVGVLTALIGVIPQWRGNFFYYVGDNVESFIPRWHMVGTALRHGEWLGFDPTSWAGGNVVGEAAYGVFNPVTLANAAVISLFDNLSLAGFFVMVEFLAILAMGTYLLAREYGAGRVPSVVVAIAVPMSGFTLWYEASGWPAGLMAFTWVTHFWWSARRHARGRGTPLVPFLFGFLAMTTGNPYAALGMVIVLGAIAVELLLKRQYARLGHVVLMGACVGVVALLVFLPLLGTSDVSARQQLANIVNDTFMVPDLGDLAASSSPTYLPSITNWNGAVLETLPSTYFAWFLLPLLPWLRWKTLRARLSGMTSLLVVIGVYLLATLGPSNLWLFRWPLRLIEYFFVGVAVLFAVLLSAGLTADRFRQRALATGVIVLVGSYLSWATHPAGLNKIHAAGFVGVAILLALALGAYFRRGMAALGAVLVVGTVAVVTLQTTVFPQKPPGFVPNYPAYDLAKMSAGTADEQGRVLQIASISAVTSEQMRSGHLLFGNLPGATGIETLTSYSGIGFLKFNDALCIDYRGATCPEAFDRLWKRAGDGIQAPLIDALGVSTLVVEDAEVPKIDQQDPPAGWEVAEHSDGRTVWVRDEPRTDDGRVTWTAPGIDVTRDASTPRRESVQYRADAAGRLVMARLDWPGYTATVDGRAIGVKDGPAGLVVLDVPAGEHTVVLSYAVPGLRLGVAATAVATVVVLLQSLFWWRQRRRSRV